MLFQFNDNGKGILTLDTDHIDYDRLCDFLGLRNREKDRIAVKKIIQAFELFANPDTVKTLLSREEIVTSGKIDFSYFTDHHLAADSEGKLYFGANNSFTQLMNKLVEEGLLERKLKEEMKFGKKHDKPVYSLNPKRIYELTQ